MATDVVDLLLAQHEEIFKALDEVRANTGGPRADAFSRLEALLTAHEHGEQKVVHPVTLDATGDPEIVEDRLREERHADFVLAELRGLDLDSDDFDERFAEFRDAVIAHAGWEERVEFPSLRATQTTERLIAMAGELRAAQAMI